MDVYEMIQEISENQKAGEIFYCFTVHFNSLNLTYQLYNVYQLMHFCIQ